MTKQTTDDRQAEAIAGAKARVSMAQIMEADT
jgi:hypothetical protein